MPDNVEVLSSPRSPAHLKTPDIVDEIGTLSAEISEREKRLTKLREEAIKRAKGKKYLHGVLFSLTIIAEGSMTRLDIELVKAEMGLVWYAAHCKTSIRKAFVQAHAKLLGRRAA